MKKGIAIASLVIFLLAPLTASTDEANNAAVDQAANGQQLMTKLASLKAEQEFLLFKKTFYETDSKYLVLDLAAGKGMMLYRNRVLRTFSLKQMSNKTELPARGVIMMTGKIDGSSKRRALVFGSTLSLHGRKADAGQAKHAGYRMGTKDLAALFYALELGAKAFVK